jgi:hypothetical protein
MASRSWRSPSASATRSDATFPGWIRAATLGVERDHADGAPAGALHRAAPGQQASVDGVPWLQPQPLGQQVATNVV